MTMVTGLFKDKDSAELAFQSVVDLILLGVKAHSDADAVQIQQRWHEGGGESIHS